MTTRKKLISIVAIAVIAAVLPGMYFGGIYPIEITSIGLSPAMEYEELMEKSQLVVKGKIISSETNVEFLDEDELLLADITTIWTLDIKKVIKGDHTGKKVKFATSGGTYNNMKHTAMHSPNLEIGDKMIVFLTKEPASEWGDNYYIHGVQSGVYKIKDNKADNDFMKKSFNVSDFEKKLKDNKHSNK